MRMMGSEKRVLELAFTIFDEEEIQASEERGSDGASWWE